MKRFLAVFILACTASLAWAGDWTGAGIWKETIDPITLTGGFVDGYIDTVQSKFPWTVEDDQTWSWISLTVGLKLRDAVDVFYSDPANLDVSPIRAMRLCLESLIARTPQGPRLLAAIGVKVPKLAKR